MARRRFPGLDFRIGTVECLPMETGSVKGYRAERLYQHLTTPAAGLAEANRVLAPGGRIVIVDLDYDTVVLDAGDQHTTRTMIRALSDSIVSRWIGRQLRGLLLKAGFSEVEMEVRTQVYTVEAEAAPVLGNFVQAALASGAISGPNADVWLTDLKQRGERGEFFFARPVFLASGRKK